MKAIPCVCGEARTEVINAEQNLRVGWYCSNCRGFTKAIGRERTWRPCHARSDNVPDDGGVLRGEGGTPAGADGSSPRSNEPRRKR